MLCLQCGETAMFRHHHHLEAAALNEPGRFIVKMGQRRTWEYLMSPNRAAVRAGHLDHLPPAHCGGAHLSFSLHSSSQRQHQANPPPRGNTPREGVLQRAEERSTLFLPFILPLSEGGLRRSP